MVTVEKYHSALHFRWKKAKKSVNFICCRPPGGKCRSSRSGGGRPRTPLGPLPTGLLKPSKVLVTNSRDRGSEVERKIRNPRRSKVPPLTEKSELRQRFATQPSGSVEQGGLQPSCSSTNDCAPPGGVAVTVLRDNLCNNKRLR